MLLQVKYECKWISEKPFILYKQYQQEHKYFQNNTINNLSWNYRLSKWGIFAKKLYSGPNS